MTPTLGAAFVLGLAASAHCVLMCGPLAAAVQPRSWHGAAAMHGTRVAVYAGIGAIAGAAGAAAGTLGLGRWIAVIAAIALLVQAAAAWRGTTGTGRFGRHASRLVAAIAGRIHARGRWTPVMWGLINGLLPCGMVYSAATAAAGLADPVAGAAAMFVFGLGTIPAVALAARPVAALGRHIAVRRPWLTPAMLILLALMIAMRGLPTLTRSDASAGQPHQHTHVSNPQR